MAATMIIPFNFQPETSGSTIASYTVPAGKYARVNISDLVLPILNGTALTTSISIFSPAVAYPTIVAPVGTTCQTLYGTFHYITMTTNLNNTATNVYLGQVFSGSTPLNAIMAFSTYGQTRSFTFTRPTRNPVLSIVQPTTMQYFSNCNGSVYEGNDELWLKSGDVITFSSGRLIYTEYNNIS